MASLTVPDRYLAAAPVIVTSPTQRCGTTLVQRLLTASDNGFIYGEQTGTEFKTLTGWFMGQLKFVEEHGEALQAEFDKALAGDFSEWRPRQTPPPSVILQTWVEIFYQMPYALAQQGEAVGRPIWGFKYPAYTRDTLKAILSLLPRSKVLYVFRNLVDVLKSAKSRQFVNTPEETADFCAAWATNLTEVSDMAQDERILFIRYEDMVAQREDHVRLLELVTGVTGMDPRVFGSKINTFLGDAERGYSPTQYIEPSALNEADRAAIRDKAGSVMERLYPEGLAAL